MGDPFWQRAVLAAIGPLVAAFVGTLGIGLFAAWITERVQLRRQDPGPFSSNYWVPRASS